MDFIESIVDFLGRTGVAFSKKALDDLNTEIALESGNNRLVLAAVGKNMVNDINRSHIDPSSRIIWEDQWQRQPKAVESRIVSLLQKSKRIHARETKIEAITKPELQEFLTEHHVSEPMNSKYKLGLFHKNNLVAVSAFGKSCPIDLTHRKVLSIELIRFCNLSGATVVGGMSKMMKHALKLSGAEDIMTYADLDWSTTGTYELLGFKETGRHEPLTYWVDLDTWQRQKAANSEGRNAQIVNRGSVKYNTCVE
jgi:hypothetical protein